MSSVNTGVSMKVSFIREGYAIDVYKSMAYANQQALQLARFAYNAAIEFGQERRGEARQAFPMHGDSLFSTCKKSRARYSALIPLAKNAAAEGRNDFGLRPLWRRENCWFA